MLWGPPGFREFEQGNATRLPLSTRRKEDALEHVGPWKNRARVRVHVPAVCGVTPSALERALCLPSNEPKTTPIDLLKTSRTTLLSSYGPTYLEQTADTLANGVQDDYLRAIPQQLNARLT
jgi:hypothetical protein